MREERLYHDGDWKRETTIENNAHLNKYRTQSRRDYGRLIHAPSFRRLQGKPQLFPGAETDFFRNRLTHSIEVAQIARMIAAKLNSEQEELRKNEIDLDLVEFAGLAHDIGHPPFGHNGEEALHRKMVEHGGFEGNAQSLRILARLEKRWDAGDVPPAHRDGEDQRRGLNLTYRTLASILKYDNPIPRKCKTFTKGYYSSEKRLVEQIKKHVLGDRYAAFTEQKTRKFKTIECSIMDVADDIAYSTYDLEDAFKAEFLNPLRLLSKLNGSALGQVTDSVNKGLEKEGLQSITVVDVTNIAARVFNEVIDVARSSLQQYSLEKVETLAAEITESIITDKTDALVVIRDVIGRIFDSEKGIPIDAVLMLAHRHSDDVATDGYRRSRFTSDLISSAVAGVELSFDHEFPPLSKVALKPEMRRRVEVLKRINYELTIMSSRLKIIEYRGGEIVGKIFDALYEDGGERLLPSDYASIVVSAQDNSDEKARAICDFVACMTDRYALEFHRRLTEPGESIFKPF